MEALENNQRQLEPHTLYHGQPMEFVQHWRDVVELSCTPSTENSWPTVLKFVKKYEFYQFF